MKIGRLHLFLAAVAAVGTLSGLMHATYSLLADKTSWFSLAYSDIVSTAPAAHGPGIPYVDYPIEYPVLTGLFIRLMGVLGHGDWQYYALTSAYLTIFAVLATYLLYHAAKPSDSKRLLPYWILAPSMFVFLIYNWDIMAVLCVIAAIYLTGKDRDCLASVALAFGFSCKLYPVLFLVPLLAKHRTLTDRVKIIGAFGATALALNIFFIMSNFDGWYYFFSYNSTRAPNPDSIWGVAEYWIAPLTTNQVNILSGLLFAAGSAIVVWKLRHDSTIKMCFALTLVFLLANKVFSPQYALWLLPFFVLLPGLCAGMGGKLFYAFEISNVAVFVCFLSHWVPAQGCQDLVYAFQFFAVVRHILLLWMLVIVIRSKPDSPLSPESVGDADRDVACSRTTPESESWHVNIAPTLQSG